MLRCLTEEAAQTGSKYMKRFLTSLITREMQIHHGMLYPSDAQKSWQCHVLTRILSTGYSDAILVGI